MIADDLTTFLLTRPGATDSAWGWATVTQVAPIRIRLDGTASAQDATPQSLVSGLVVNDRVWVQIAGRRLVIHGSPAMADRMPRGLLASVELTASETASSTTLYSEIAGLSVASMTVGPGTRRVAVVVNTTVSITGTGPVQVLGRVRTGASAVICAARTVGLATNGNGPLVMSGTIDLAAGEHNLSFQILPDPGGVTARARGDLAKCSLFAHDIGPA